MGIDGIDEDDDVDSVVVIFPAFWILNKGIEDVHIKRETTARVFCVILYDCYWRSFACLLLYCCGIIA